jgi:hypothetical protein
MTRSLTVPARVSPGAIVGGVFYSVDGVWHVADGFEAEEVAARGGVELEVVEGEVGGDFQREA